MKVEYDCGCKTVVNGRVMKFTGKLCPRHGPAMLKDDFVKHLHAEAERIERKGLSDWATGNVASAHQQMDVARSLRTAANFVDGVQAT